MVTTSQQRRLDAWSNRLTPQERDYDRFVAGQIPQGASWSAETTWGRLAGRARLEAMVADPECRGCACHRNPPCFHCEEGHRDHDHDDGLGVDSYELEWAEAMAHEENEARERGNEWRAYAAAHPDNTTIIEV